MELINIMAKSVSENKAGRPTVITPKVVSKLEALFSVGLTVREACLESGISHEAYYSRVRSDEQFADKMANAQNNLTNTAKKVVAYKLMDQDAKTAMWWLDRLDKKEMAKQQAVTDGLPTAETETEPLSFEDMIELYEGYEMMLGLKHKMELEYPNYPRTNNMKPMESYTI